MPLISTLSAAVLCLSLSATAQADSTISGPQVDKRVTTFSVTVCNGRKVGRRRGTGWWLSYGPVVMVFTRTTDDATAGLVKQLDQFVAANRKQNLIAVVVFLGDDAEATQKAAIEFGKKHKVTNVTLATPRLREIKNGYAKLKLNPKATTTVVITKRRRIVTANYVFGGNGPDDSANKRVIAATQAGIVASRIK